MFCRWISLPKYKNASVWLKTLRYTGYQFRILCLIILTEAPLRLWLPHEFEALHVAGCQAVLLKGNNFIFQYFITASPWKKQMQGPHSLFDHCDFGTLQWHGNVLCKTSHKLIILSLCADRNLAIVEAVVTCISFILDNFSFKTSL